MSASAMPAEVSRPVTSMRLTEQLCTLLEALFGNCRGLVHMSAGRGASAQEFRHAVAAGFRLVPPRLLREYEYDVVDELRLCTMTTDQSGGLLDCPALWVELPTPPVFADEGRGWAWRVPPETLAAATTKLGAFPLPMTLLVDAFDHLLALWLLDTPARLDDPAVLARVESLQRGLAEALGGCVDDVVELLPTRATRASSEQAPSRTLRAYDPRRAVLRLPGSTVRDHGAPVPVVLAYADLSRRFTLAAIEAALMPPASSKAPKVRK